MHCDEYIYIYIQHAVKWNTLINKIKQFAENKPKEEN